MGDIAMTKFWKSRGMEIEVELIRFKGGWFNFEYSSPNSEYGGKSNLQVVADYKKPGTPEEPEVKEEEPPPDPNRKSAHWAFRKIMIRDLDLGYRKPGWVGTVDTVIHLGD